MALRGLTDKAKKVFEQRGGSERLKQDGEALKGIARGEGSVSEKAKAGMERLRKPQGETGAGRADDPPPPARTDPHPAPGSPPTSAEPPGAPPSRS